MSTYIHTWHAHIYTCILVIFVCLFFLLCCIHSLWSTVSLFRFVLMFVQLLCSETGFVISKIKYPVCTEVRTSLLTQYKIILMLLWYRFANLMSLLPLVWYHCWYHQPSNQCFGTDTTSVYTDDAMIPFPEFAVLSCCKIL